MSIIRSHVGYLASARRRRLADFIRGVLVLCVGTVVEVGLRTVRLDRLAGWFGINFLEAPSVAPATTTLNPRDRRRARLAYAVMRNWPFGRGPCLRQALVVGWVLRRHRPVLHLGVATAEGFAAHAWLEVAGETIGGATGFAPLGRTSPTRNDLR